MSQWDFFVSYTAADQDWAEWVAWQLEDAGYQVLIQAWDFVPGSNWAVRMQQGTTEAERTIALLSAAYLRSVYGQNEWHAAHTADPAGFTRRLLPVRVEDCPRPGLLGQIVTIDLFGHPADTARQHLLDAITTARAGRAKPTAAPAFPPGQALPLQQTPTTATEPPFPGPVTPDPDQPALHGRTRPGRIPRGLSRRDLSLTVALLFATGTGLLVRSTQDDNPTATSTGPAAPTPTAVRTSTPTPHRPRPPLTDHTGPVRSVVFSPDGETLASGSQDGTIRLWNIATQDSQPLPGGITVWSVAFSPDGRTLASGSNDHTVRLWDMTAGPLPELVASRTEHTASVGSVAFSLDRHTLASGSNDHTVRLWDATDPAAPRLLHTLTDNTGPVNTVAFSPDRRTLASGSGNINGDDSTVWLWNIP
ncbi:toll/interleukin-1 receptor domain-containing protein [Parafrankia sp. FMc2]|uniref:toll/interleukin-1 receptor domain-containing protein n=1 Tax=Parafrankia sp. FMc2 TaxID=3233196 RepID=UPI0034D673E4